MGDALRHKSAPHHTPKSGRRASGTAYPCGARVRGWSAGDKAKGYASRCRSGGILMSPSGSGRLP
ncbi:hypothetical protein BVY11_27835 [Pseudomonas amygdali pv. morsprunorum]|nr:hypothetical protein BVY11_27835 [Pseudomonas amygdali pv. morsprunorum]PPS26530.1 hypothetical protein BVY12_27820 [Pseudomonas amygdali pv. morsprunorum]